MTFQYLFKPKGAGTFFYSFRFYGGTFRLCCVITTKRLLPSVDEPHQGSRPQSTTWTDSTRVENLYKSTNWMNKTKGSRPQSITWMDTKRVENLYKYTKWTDPTDGQD